MSDTNLQFYKDGQITFETANGDRRIIYGSATGQVQGLTIEYDITTTPKTFEIQPSGVRWNNGVLNYTTDLDRLAVIQTAFQAVELPPNATTLQLNNTLLLNDAPTTTNAITLNANTNSVVLTDGSVAPSISLGGALSIDGNGANIKINSAGVNLTMGDVGGSNNNTQILVDDGHLNIDFNSINLSANMDTYTLPICFSYLANGNINYPTASSWIEVFNQSIPFPSFVMDAQTNPAYATWSINFALNCRNMADQVNKFLAIYFELEDTGANTYSPFLFNANTPFTKAIGVPSNYFASSTHSENYIWSDCIDLNAVSGQVPLALKLYWYANAVNNFDFDLLITFTKTNVLT